ncbi:hypothetical protein EC988_002330 [Linderina pennispora]|nr:hypothetical protein EC988_002330 [Linderina pennispora]
MYRNERALIFPGQGSQVVGMGRDLYEAFPASKQVFEEVDEVLGFKLSSLMFEGNQAELTLTKNAQPAIVTVSVAATRALEHATGLKAEEMYAYTMGHSVGEFSALIVAGVVSLEDGIRLIRTRGESMQDAVKEREYAMSACMLRRATVADVVAEVDRIQHTEVANELGAGEIVQVANINSSSQIVLSGSKKAVERAIGVLHAKRLAMRAINLPVSAPFHCKLMTPASEALEKRIGELKPVRGPDEWLMPVISNVTARPYQTAADVEELLVRQVDNTVQWLQSMEYLKQHGVQRWGAMAPGNVVGNLASKEYAKDIVRRLSDVAAIHDFAAVLRRQQERGY